MEVCFDKVIEMGYLSMIYIEQKWNLIIFIERKQNFIIDTNLFSFLLLDTAMQLLYQIWCVSDSMFDTVSKQLQAIINFCFNR